MTRCPGCFEWKPEDTFQQTPSCSILYGANRTPPVNVCESCREVIPLVNSARPELHAKGAQAIRNLMGYAFGRIPEVEW